MDSKYVHQRTCNETHSIQRQSSIADSAISSPPVKQKELSPEEAIKQKKLSSLPSQEALIPSGPARGDDSRHSSLPSEGGSSIVERSTVELLQNLTSIIANARSMPASPPTTDTISQVSPAASISTSVATLEQQSCHSGCDKLSQAAVIVASLSKHLSSGGDLSVTLGEHNDNLIGFHECNRVTEAFDCDANSTSLSMREPRDSEAKTATVKERSDLEQYRGSACLVAVNSERNQPSNSSTLPLLSEFGPGRLSPCGAHHSAVSQSRQWPDGVTKLGDRLGNRESSRTATDHTEQRKRIEAKNSYWYTAGSEGEVVFLSHSRSVDSPDGQARADYQNLPQTFNHRSPQGVKQRSRQTPSGYKELYSPCCVAVSPVIVGTSRRKAKKPSADVHVHGKSHVAAPVLTSSPYRKFGLAQDKEEGMSVHQVAAAVVTDSNPPVQLKVSASVALGEGSGCLEGGSSGGLPQYGGGDQANKSGNESFLQGGSRNVCLSDSEDTLSAASDREVNNEVEGGMGQNETRRKTRAAAKRHQMEESSNTKRKSNRGSKDTQTVCDEFNCGPSSDRRGRDASLKATQARKLLAKSKATVGLRQRRQKDRGTDLLGAAVCQTSNRAGQQSSREKTNDTSKGDGSCVREAYGRENMRKSQRKVKGRRMLCVSEDEHSDEEFSPRPAKKRRKAESHTPRDLSPAAWSQAASQNVAPNQQLKGDFLAKILTDIPEVDIGPLSTAGHMATSTNQIASATHKRRSRTSTPNDVGDVYTPPKQRYKSSQDDITLRTRSTRISQRKAHSKQAFEEVAESPMPKSSSSQKSNSRESILPHLYDQKSHDLSTSGNNIPSPELGLQNKTNSGDSTNVNASGDDRILEDSEESRTHYRVLMSWESDYLRGSKATRGPILYAMEKLSEELKAIEGPWMNKAKFIWTTWRHKVDPKVRKIYSKKAKDNRKELFGKSKVILNIRRPPLKLNAEKRRSLRRASQSQQLQRERQQPRKQVENEQRTVGQPRSRTNSPNKQPKLSVQENVEELYDDGESRDSLSTEASSLCSDALSDGAEAVCREVNNYVDYETIVADESSNRQGQSLAVPSAPVALPVQSSAHEGQSLSSLVTALPGQSSYFRGQSIISAVSNTTPKQHTTVDHSSPHTHISSIEDGNKPTSQKTSRSPRSPTTVNRTIPTRQSIQFTDGSLKVSLRRPQALSFPAQPQPVASPFVFGSGLDSSKTSNSATSGLHSSLTHTLVESASNSTSTTPPTTTTPSSIIDRPHPSITPMPSSEELARYFTSLSPLPPVSPKRKKSPNTRYSTDKSKSPAHKRRNSPPEKLVTHHNKQQIANSSQDKPSAHSNKLLIPPVVASSPYFAAASSSPSLSSSVSQCSITTQARVMSPTAAGTVEPERRPHRQAKDQPICKPTPSSIYQQLLADNKLSLNKGKKKNPQTKKTKSGSSGGLSKASAKRSPKEGLSSKLHMSAPLCTNFPTFVIPHIPMGGGSDPSIIVSPVWLGPGSFSGLMSTLPSAPPNNATVHSTLHATAHVPLTLPPPITAQVPSNVSLSTAHKTHPPVPSHSPFSTAVRSASHICTTVHAPVFNPLKSLSSATHPPTAHVPPSVSLTAPPQNSASSVLSALSAAPKSSPSLASTTITTTIATGSLVTNNARSKRASSNVHQAITNYSTSGIPLKPSRLSSAIAQATTEQPSPLGFGSTQLGSFQRRQSSGFPIFPPDLPPKSSTTFNLLMSLPKKGNQTSHLNSITETKVATQAQVMNGQSSVQEEHHRRWSAANKGSNSYTPPNNLSAFSTRPVQIDMYPDSPPTPSQLSTSLFLPINEHRHHARVVTSTSNNGPATLPTSSSNSSPISSPFSLLVKHHGQFRLPSASSEVTSELHSRLKSPIASCSSITAVPLTVTTNTTSSCQSPTTESGITISPMTECSNIPDVNSMAYRRLILRKVQQWNEEKQRNLHGKAKRTKLMSPSLVDDSDSFKSPSSIDTASPVEQLSSTNPMSCTDPKTTPDSVISSPSPKLLTVGPPITFAETLIPRTISSPLINRKSLLSTLTSPPVPSVASSAMQMDDILSVSYGSSIVAPSVVFNSAFMGDISSMSRWELEQLYKHNMEKLEQQKKFIRTLEVQLKKIHEQHVNFGAHKPSQSEIYQRFLSFVVEPDLVPDVPIVGADKFGYGHLLKQTNGTNNTPTLDFHEVIKGGTSDRPILNEKYDFYANFGRL